MADNLESSALVDNLNTHAKRKEKATVVQQSSEALKEGKHFLEGGGDADTNCEVCSKTSADLVAGATVGAKKMDDHGNSPPMTQMTSGQDDTACSGSSFLDRPQDNSSMATAARSKLLKDDSGICVRESLTSDDSKCEDEDLTGKLDGSGRPSLPSVSTESEGLVADILDSEESENNAVADQEESNSNVTMTTGDRQETEADNKEDTTEKVEDVGSSENAVEDEASPAAARNRSITPDILNQSGDSSDMEVINIRRRRRRLQRSSDSTDSSSSASSTTTSGPDEQNSDDDDDDNDEDLTVDMDGDMSSMPTDPWKAMTEVRRREIGFSNRMPCARMFRQRVGSSLKFVQRLELQHKLEYHEGCVNALNFNKSGTLLASGSDDLKVVIWNWTEKEPYLRFESGHRSNVFQCKFMPYTGDTHIVTCARDGHVRLAELSSTGVCKSTRKLAKHQNAAHKLALLQDSSHVFYSCGEDAYVFEIDLRQDKPNKLSLTRENDKKVALYSIHSNPFKSHEYCVGGRDHFIRIYDKRMINESTNNGVLKKYCPHHLVDHNDIKANVTCAVYNWNGSEVLGTYNDEDIYLFDNSHSDGSQYVHRYSGHRNNSTVKGVNFYGPKSEYVISGSDCSNVFLWEKESEKIVQYFHADVGGVVNVLEPHPHAPILATSGLDADVKIWAPTAREPTTLKGLKKVTRQNERERASERSSEPDMIDSQMLWFLMQHLRRSARRRARQEEESPPSSSSDSDDGSDDSDHPPEPVQCAPQ